LTFNDIDRQADAIARGLLAAGLKKGDHIGIWAFNVPSWAPLFYAAARVGIITVPININCKHREIGYIMGHADIKGLFFIEKFRDTSLAEILYQVIPELGSADAGKLKSAQFPSLGIIVGLGGVPNRGMYTFDEFVGLGSNVDNAVLREAETAVGSDDVVSIMYTSGTTGFPKGAMLTHRGMVNSAYYIYCKQALPDESSVVLNTLPYFYISALSEAVIGSLLYGYKIVEPELFEPLFCLETVQKEKCSWIFGVPTVFLAMMGHPRCHEFDLQSVKNICIGGTHCPAELLKNIFLAMKLENLYHGYGLTETSPFITVILIKDAADPRLDTIGKPMPGMEVSIRDRENNECPVNTEGEICTRGFGVMPGYYKMEDATRETIDADGWLHTGDLGRAIDGGYYVIGGRLKELIIRGSENIYPKEVENLLLSMPGVHDAQVVGIPSQKFGEEAAAFIVRKDGAQISEQDVKNFCLERISSFKCPEFVFFTESFPLSGNGKVQKFRLCEMALQKLKEKT
ncbi:MAG: AMP-binding protein, partial [Treponema sp.]|nr:AMP-binding protein [Treponema sp.]